MLTHEEFKKKALARPGVRAEYERLAQEEFSLLDILLTARSEAGLTREDIAVRMGTQTPAVARIEKALASGKNLPSVSTVRRYLAACGKRLIIEARPV